jgi:hypothetical protein
MLPDFESLRTAAVEGLHQREVFDIDAYGWLNEDDVDPDFVGYAMWTTSPPYDHDFESWQRDVPPSRPPTVVQQRLMELGHDFFGLMKTARHFIGFALLAQPAVPPLRIEPTNFDFNEFAALLALTSASDRLRDFIIVVTQDKKSEDRDQLEKALTLLRAAGLNAEADRLTTEAIALRTVRDARNTAAHGLGTQPARVQRRLIEMDRKAFLNRTWHKADEVTFEEMIAAGKKQDDEERAAVEARAQRLCECYKGLVKLGDACFRAEYAWRHRGLP